VSLTLAIDTATDVASVAVGRDRALLAEITLAGRRHGAALLPTLTEAARLAGGSLADVGRVVLADGPGSFTGLRIGAATVQGLVRAQPGLAVAAAPSLLAAAWAASRWHAGPVAALYDALRGDVFGAVYAFGDRGIETIVPPTLLTVARLRALTPTRPMVAVGDGAVRYADDVRDWTGRAPIGPPQGSPRAAALLAVDGLAGGTRPVPDILAYEPDYGRPAEAQAKWERSHGRPLPDSGGHLR